MTEVIKNVIDGMERRFKSFDVEWVYYLPESYKKITSTTIREYNNKNDEENSLSSFLLQFVKLNSSPDFLSNLSNIIYVLLEDKKGHEKEKEKEKKENIRPKILYLKNSLEEHKKKIDDFHLYQQDREIFYSLVTNFFDRFSNFKQTIGKHYKYITYEKEIRGGKERTVFNNRISNAWLKCWEILHSFPIVPYYLNRKYKVFCNAEFPGSFIFAIHHYLLTKRINFEYEWVANSLWPDKGTDEGEGGNEGNEIFGDRYGLYKKYKEKWLMDGKKYTGDVMDRQMLEYVKERCQHSIDLYTSDIGIYLDHSTFHLQEELETPLNLGQIVQGLSTLREGGTLICKMFMFFTPFNQSMLSMLNEMFTSFYITKPVTSRPGNSEIYIVGCDYKGYEKNREMINILEESLFDWKEERNKMWLRGGISPSFYLKLVYTAYLIYGQQIRFINENIELAKEMWKLVEKERKEKGHVEKERKKEEIYREMKNVICFENVWKTPFLKKIYERREKEVNNWYNNHSIDFLPLDKHL